MENKNKTIYLATDHAGFELKNFCYDFLKKEGYDVADMGATEYDKNDDFPTFIKLAAEKVSEDPKNSLAIIFGGSGQGEAMVANRFGNVRATVYYGESMDIIKLSKQHNDANVLSIGARFVSKRKLKKVLKMWLSEKLDENPKYKRRIEMF